MVTVFGGTGYIGSRFCEMFAAEPQPRHNLVPQRSKMLYLISTTHNHHLATNPYIDIDTNLTHLIRVLENVRRTPGVEFNFVSSWFVYGAVSGPATERAHCHPQGFYSITKHTAEQLLIEYCGTYRIPYRVLRLCNVVGGLDRSAGVHKNVLHSMARSIKKHEPITMVNHGDFWRDYLHRDDICRAINFAIDQAPINDIINIGSGSPIKFREAIDYCMSVCDSASRIEHLTRYDVIDCMMDTKKLQNLGWRPSLSWQQAVDDILIHC